MCIFGLCCVVLTQRWLIGPGGREEASGHLEGQVLYRRHSQGQVVNEGAIEEWTNERSRPLRQCGSDVGWAKGRGGVAGVKAGALGGDRRSRRHKGESTGRQNERDEGKDAGFIVAKRRGTISYPIEEARCGFYLS
jgi:hypothetical protein